MKIKAFITAITLLMFFFGATTAQAEPFNRYFTAQGALADVDGFDSGIGVVATYGVRVPEMHKNFSFEAEFSGTIVEPEGTVGGTVYEASYYTLAGYGAYSHPLSNKVHLRGRAGILYENVEINNPAGGKSDDDFGISFGFGATIGLSKDSRFIVEYTVIESDINQVSVGLQFNL